MKKYLYTIFIPIIYILLVSLLFSIINLFNIEIVPFMYLIMICVLSMYIGYIYSKNCKNKYYQKGIITGIVFSIISFIISFLISRNLNEFNIIYYLIIILSSTVGSMLNTFKK